jgi:hypothetical protein
LIEIWDRKKFIGLHQRALASQQGSASCGEPIYRIASPSYVEKGSEHFIYEYRRGKML